MSGRPPAQAPHLGAPHLGARHLPPPHPRLCAAAAPAPLPGSLPQGGRPLAKSGRHLRSGHPSSPLTPSPLSRGRTCPSSAPSQQPPGALRAPHRVGTFPGTLTPVAPSASPPSPPVSLLPEKPGSSPRWPRPCPACPARRPQLLGVAPLPLHPEPLLWTAGPLAAPAPGPRVLADPEPAAPRAAGVSRPHLRRHLCFLRPSRTLTP